MSVSRSKTSSWVIAGLVAAGLAFCYYMHLRHAAQHPGVEPRFMVKSFVRWKSSTTAKPHQMTVVKRCYYDYDYSSWVYEVRYGAYRHEALETELDVFLP